LRSVQKSGGVTEHTCGTAQEEEAYRQVARGLEHAGEAGDRLLVVECECSLERREKGGGIPAFAC
jgi:hypothetical protein